MKERLKNKLTSWIGVILMAVAIFLYVAGKYSDKFETSTSTLELATIAVLGWVFLTARDTLLEGLFLNLFKIKKEE
jgi:hypothetical protein